MVTCRLVPASLWPSKPIHLLPSKIQPSLKPYPLCNQSIRDSRPSSSIAITWDTTFPVGGGARGGARKRVRYRKPNPGEKEGIVEEMRFVAMRLRHTNTASDGSASPTETAAWKPTMGGFLSYLVDSKLVFDTLEQIVEDSTDVTYVYFRRTGLERSTSLAKDLEWFEHQGEIIPPASSPGTAYATYLENLADKSAPSFLCHLYNIYFAHVFGGCGIGKQVCEKLLGRRELEFYKWEGDVELSLKNVRQNLNKLGEHWPRSEKNKCLREAAKSLKFSGQIVRLIILPVHL